MNLDKIRINDIPAIIWGEPSDKMIIASHGSHSSKIDDCIWILAEEATKKAIRCSALIFLGTENEYMKQNLLCQTNAFVNSILCILMP